jgi:hypothetical protein
MVDDQRGLLLWDGHLSRADPDSLQRLRNINVDVITIMAHTSHVAQPLDLVIFGKFKNCLTDLGRSTITQDLSEKRKFMVTTSLKSLHQALYPDYIISSFAKAGIVPSDHCVVLSDPRLCSSHLYLEQLSTTKRTRSGIDISANLFLFPVVKVSPASPKVQAPVPAPKIPSSQVKLFCPSPPPCSDCGLSTPVSHTLVVSNAPVRHRRLHEPFHSSTQDICLPEIGPSSI